MRPNQYHAHRLLERAFPQHAPAMLRGLLRTSIDELVTSRQPPPPYNRITVANSLSLLRSLLRRLPARKALEEMATFNGRGPSTNRAPYAVRLLRRLNKCTS